MKLIACDLDGTIIDEHNHCDSSVIETVKKIHQHQDLFAICSGRPVDSYSPLLKEWGLEGMVDYLIGSNGGEIHHVQSGQREIPYCLEPEVLLEIMDLYEPLGLIPTLYEGAMFYAQKITPQVEVVAKRVRQEVRQADIRSITTSPQIKLMFVLDPEKMSQAEEFLLEHPDPRYCGYKTAYDLLEFNHASLGKDTGLQVVGKKEHISSKDMIAFGDTTNDIPMLKYAGIGVCMENGTSDAKVVADWIAPSVQENGFAKVMNQFYEGKEKKLL